MPVAYKNPSMTETILGNMIYSTEAELLLLPSVECDESVSL
jgi:hypothetical protein